MSNLQQYLDIYNKEVELPGTGESVTIRPVTTNMIKKLLANENSNNPDQDEKILDDVIRFSVGDDIDIKNMYIDDRYFLFFEIRKITKGTEYQYELTCPKCGTQNIETLDLENVSIINRKEDIDKNIKILNDNITLVVDNIKRNEQMESIKNIITKGKNQKEIEVDKIINYISTVIKEIYTPDGKEDITFTEKLNFISNLPEKEYTKIKNKLDEIKFGPILMDEVTCLNCGYTNRETIPLDNFFS